MKLPEMSYRSVVVGLVGLLVGGLLLLVADAVAVTQSWLSVLLNHVGSFVIASVAMAVIFEYWQLRGLLSDMRQHVRWSEQLEASGLSGFTLDFEDGVPWLELFRESNRLDVVFSYATTWRNRHKTHLEDFLAKKDSSLEVVLPDPDVERVLTEMVSRFGKDEATMRENVLAAYRFFRDLGDRCVGAVRIYYLPRVPAITFYRFNNRAVLASYRLRTGKGQILSFLCDRRGEGKMYNWLRDEWYAITEQRDEAAPARLVYPPPDTG